MMTALDVERAARARREVLVAHLAARGDLESARVRDAMLRVGRERFVAEGTPLDVAYFNRPLAIGYGQTISEPTVVAVMTEALDLRGGERVLEIGTGSGYQAAILSLLAAEVFTIERIPQLAERARRALGDLGCTNVQVRAGDGYRGWPERAPFDRILITAAPPEVPGALLEELAEDGLLVAPIGPEERVQRLVRLRKRGAFANVEDLGPVEFVPMVPGAMGA